MNQFRLSKVRRIVLLGLVLALLGVAVAVSANLMPQADPDSRNQEGSCSTAAGCDKGDAKNKDEDGTVRCLALECGPDTPVNSGTITPEPRPPDQTGPGSAGVSNYDECVKAGYPIAESYPPQCISPNGSFVGSA